MRIINKTALAEILGVKISKFVVESPDVAQKAKPGQFIVLMVCEEGERIPLTVVDCDASQGTITLIVQELGFSTKLIGDLNAGDRLYALTGPLGHATDIQNYGTVILVGGGVGIAEIYPVARALKEMGNRVLTILGGRTKDLVILEEEMRRVSTEVHVATDDGSHGRKGFTTDVLKELLAKEKCDLVYAVGPIPMMKKVSQVTQTSHVKTLVSLNALMVDATGMCGGCRVTLAGVPKFSCVDGPEFDAHEVDWSELEKRNRVYVDKEKHICNLYRSHAGCVPGQNAREQVLTPHPNKP